MPAEQADADSALRPLPRAFLDQLANEEELLVSSRDHSGRGTVRMWFAVVPPGYVYLLTPTITLKAERWRHDPWVRFQIPGSEADQEGLAIEATWEEAEPHLDLLTGRFAMAGAATGEALRWMIEDGSRRLLKVGRGPGATSEAVG
ncbi:MAG TPA: hypothetical protein VMV09_03250 [Candidatus Saccharimonadales bacterium]|nr:hypothetical protein [Candidatus Saccharimonadales bacterium]